MADGDESLLDVFVNIRPDPAFQDIIRASANAAIDEYTRIFSSATLPSPTVRPPNVGGGAPGGGGGGNSGGGGGTGGAGLAQEYRDAARALEDLQRNLRTVNREASLSGVVQFDDEVKRLQDQLSDLILNVRRQTQDRDLLGIQSSLEYIDPLRREIQNLFNDVSSRRPIKEQFDFAVAGGQQAISEGRITNRLEASLVRGLPSAEIRQQIAVVRAEVERAEQDVRRLSRAFDGTEQSVENVVNAVRVLSEAQESLRGTYQTAQQASQSMNTLTNNAYQLGQAFEDFSVGFSLNGIAGGIRGAANNVAFLLNDLSRTPALQNAIGERFARMLPLVAGIGSAVAITIVPAVIEWLATLNDVELELEDIQERLKQTAKDSDFASGLRASNDQLLETLKTAGSVRDVLEQIKQITFDSQQGNKRITESFQALTDSGDVLSTLNNLLKLSAATDDYVNMLERLAKEKSIAVPGEFGGPPILLSEEEIKSREKELADTVKLRDSIRQVRTDLLNAQREAVTGGKDQESAIAKANESYKNLSKTIDELQKLGAFGDVQKLEESKAIVEAFRIEFEKISDLSQEVGNGIRTQLPSALQAVVDQSDKLAFGLEVAKQNALGMASDTAVMLAGLQQSNAEFREMLNLQIQIAQSQNVDPELINEANRRATITQFRLQEVEILREIKKKQDEIDKAEEKKGKAKFTNVEQFVRDLQVNVLGPDDRNRLALEENTREIERLQQVLELMRKNQDDNLAPIGGDPVRAARVLSDRQATLDSEIQNAILPQTTPVLLSIGNDPLFQIMTQVLNDQLSVQKGTLNEQRAVNDNLKNIKPGAVAR